MAQMVKNPPAMKETWVRFLGWEDPLEKGMATRSEERRVGKEWGPEEKGTTEDEMVGWHH